MASPLSPALHAELSARVLEAAARKEVGAWFAPRFIQILDCLLEHGELPTRKIDPALFKVCQRQRTEFKDTEGKPRKAEHLARIAFFDALPQWEWKRRHGTYPDTAAHLDRCERTMIHVTTHGELPAWDTARELYVWLRYCYQKGPTTLGPMLAARVEAIPGFDWKGKWDRRRITHGRPRTTKNARQKPGPKTATSNITKVAATAPSPPVTAPKPKKPEATCGSARPPYVAPARPADPIRPCPTGRRTPDPAVDPAFKAAPKQWCKDHIDTLALRDDFNLTSIARLAGVTPVAAHHWLRNRTGMGITEWRRSHGWLTGQVMSPQRAAWIRQLWGEAPEREPVKRFASRTQIPVRQVSLVIDTYNLGPAGKPDLAERDVSSSSRLHA